MTDNTNFTVTDKNLIVFKGKRIAYAHNGELLILAAARTNFDVSDHTIFDALLNNYKEPRRYIVDFTSEFDWQAKVAAFKLGTVPSGVDFTPMELGAVEALKTAEAKIKAAFGLPEIPYKNAAAIDVAKIYGAHAEAARRWLDGETLSVADLQALKSIVAGNPAERNLLRFKMKGKVAVIENLTNHTMSENVIKKRLWDSIKRVWAAGRNDASSYYVTRYKPGNDYYATSHDVNAYPTYLSIGCQKIPRAEVERIAAARGWDMTVPA